MADDPKCDKCGAEITTGMMAVFCPHGEACEFWPSDSHPDVIQFMRDLRDGWKRGAGRDRGGYED